jgi:uncharacterized membrane protein YgcG
MRTSVTAALAANTDSLTLIGPGFLAFLVVFSLALATVLLIRSMTRHLRKVRYDAERAGAGTGGGEAVGGYETSNAAPDDAPTAGSSHGGDSPGGADSGTGGDTGGGDSGGGGGD